MITVLLGELPSYGWLQLHLIPSSAVNVQTKASILYVAKKQLQCNYVFLN